MPIAAAARKVVAALLGDRGRAWMRERRMMKDAATCPPSSDPEVERTIRDWIRPGMVVVDTGAHQGLWTFRLAKAVGPTGHVFAFEPSDEYAPGLARVLQRRGLTNVTLLTCAIGDREGVVRFKTRSADGKRLTGESRLAASADESGDLEVPLTTLDALAQKHPQLANVAFIKVDIEGAELLLFRGADRLLRTARPKMYCEIEDRHCQNFGWTRATVLEHLASLGYDATPVNPWDFRLVPRSA